MPSRRSGTESRSVALEEESKDPGTAVPEQELQGFGARRRPRWGALLLVGLFHVAALVGLVRAFAPDLGTQVMERAGALVTVVVRTRDEPPPPAAPAPDPQSVPDEGAAAPEAAAATPKEVTVPEVRTPLASPSPAPRASATGDENSAGAGESGDGTGAGGEGDGLGSGRGGGGRGGIMVTRPEKIAGDINAESDFATPPGGRQIRWGQRVVVHMTVGVDGRASNCRIVEPSPDPTADQRVCDLAEERFRFRPARDGNGDPVPAIYGWQQWWRPRG